MISQNLRERLLNITNTYILDKTPEQLSKIENLKNEGCPHSIVLHTEAVIGKPETFRFNCYMFALNLLGVKEMENIASKNADIYPNSEYVRFLINNNILKKSKMDSGVIVYFDNNSPTHAGKINKGRVLSKWGLCHTWEHNVFEVPMSYGDKVEIFNEINTQESTEAFMKFAKWKGVSE